MIRQSTRSLAERIEHDARSSDRCRKPNRVEGRQRIGEVGTTGRSVNPHLHLETRIGPAGASFTEMAHYDNGATENEMRNYCTWRVSGLYQLLNPLEVIQALSLQP